MFIIIAITVFLYFVLKFFGGFSNIQEKSKVAKVNHISKNIRQITSSPVLRRRPPSAVAIEELERKRAENEKKYKRGEVPS